MQKSLLVMLVAGIIGLVFSVHTSDNSAAVVIRRGRLTIR